MEDIKVSLDGRRYTSKPAGAEPGKITNRIGKSIVSLNSENMESFVHNVGEKGQTFSPTTFLNGRKKKENFQQMQMFVLDFDGGISYESVYNRTRKYELPILFAYDTFTSHKHDRFRIIFLNDVPVFDKMAANIQKSALMTIFPEADRTDNDISKMYYGGKELLYYDKSLPTIDMESTFRNMTYYLKEKYGPTHYKKHVKKFAKENNIKLNERGLLDISVLEDSTETNGTSPHGKNLPNAIIFSKDNGEFLPKSYYSIQLSDGCTSHSVEKRHHCIHSKYRSGVLNEIRKRCKLFREFESGERRLYHEELYGISTILIHVETGASEFKKILFKYSDYYDEPKYKRWDFYLKYIKEENYNPMGCDKYCPYKDKCSHGKNILTTVKPERGTMERVSNYPEVYHSIGEVQEDLLKKIEQAIAADDKRWHVIKAQTAAGKTEAYLNLILTSGLTFLIVVPTNKLKQDVKLRAVEKGIDLMVTPSLDEIKDEMPDYIWEQIESFRDTGQHSKVHPFISKAVEEEKIPCLEKYLKKLKKFETYEGNAITTHRRFLNMDKKMLNRYDVVIIDEDIILSSIAPNQCEISISKLKNILSEAKEEKKRYDQKKGTYKLLIKKIKKLLKATETDTMIELPGFEWDSEKDKEKNKGHDTEDEGEDDEEDEDGITAMADIPSFCLAEHFMLRKASEEKNLKKDCIVFLKPYKFKDIKHIMVSATVDKDICEYCFGKQNVKFYECKQARYAGTLNQYYDKAMSRHCIDEDPDILRKISEWSGFKYMITFKKYNISDMYFGNAIGCDYLKGQDIDVVGTPYQVDFLYKLLPFTLDLDVDEDAAMKPCRVCHNGYIFTFTTYGEEHDVLRKFHFWMIESELEQAVGRARLLRCDCTVNLFSNFPIKQAVMKESEYDNN